MTRTVELPMNVTEADTFFSRFRGLMLKKRIDANECLHIAPCDSIHMFFMRFPIDVVFLSRDKTVIRLHHDLKPWRVVWPVKQAHSVLEMAAGTIDRLALECGDEVRWVPR